MEILNKIESSFRASLKGEESTKNLIYWWGFISYFFFYFIIDKIILAVDLRLIDIVLSAIGIIYFAWHIYALKKCSPKKPKLTEEEKKKLHEDRWGKAGRAFMRKLFLQEPITKWNPIIMTMVVDLLFLLKFLGYILK